MTNDEQGGPDRLAEPGPQSRLGGAYPADGPQAGLPGTVPDGGNGPDGSATDSTAAGGATDSAGAGGATAVATATARGKSARRRAKSAWREVPVLIVLALALALVIKTFVVQPFFIPSSSMEDTLLIGDKVLVNKLVYHFRSIEPGDIVVFNGAGSWNPAQPAGQPERNPLVRAYDATLRPLFDSIRGLLGSAPGQTDYIKRVIGVPGDRVACCNAQGLVTVNGVALHESSYLYPGAAPSLIHFSLTVPAGRLWVMGDNRTISDDSRMRQNDPGHGTIPENEVVGRAMLIIWPPSRWRTLPIPSTFSQAGIDRPGSAALTPAARQATAATLLGTRVRPDAPYLPLAAGLAGAFPLTWAQRRARRGLAARWGKRRGRAQPGAARRSRRPV